MIRPRFDLQVLIASLLAATAVVATTLVFELRSETEQNRQAAMNVARLLSTLPVESLSTEETASAVNRVLSFQAGQASFAWGALADAEGRVIASQHAAGLSMPTGSPVDQSRWVSELALEVDNRPVLEVSGPIRFNNGVGQYRFAVLQPTLMGMGPSASRLAWIVLPVLLLTPLVLFFLRREVSPLRKLTAELSDHEDQDPQLGDFASQFNHFVDKARKDIEAYQSEHDKLVTAERFLTYRLAKLESILHAVPGGIAILDQNLRTTLVNRQFSRWLDIPEEALVGKTPAEWTVPDSLQKWLQQTLSSDVRDTGSCDFSPEHAPELTLRASLQRIQRDGEAEPIGQCIAISDISGESQAHAARGEFVAHVAHELKTPLNTLGLCAQSLQGPDGDDETFRLETLNVVNDEVERLALLINNLLSITQIEMGTLALNKTRTRIADLVNDSVESVSRSAGDKQLRFSVDAPADDQAVQIDKELMRIALNNLLTNAVKYSDDGGIVRVAVAETDESLQISVTDTGIGIPESERDRIFEKFVRGEGDEVSQRTGHGLGLALSRDIVELHHGNLRVQSKVGAGSKFTIELWKHLGVMEQAI